MFLIVQYRIYYNEVVFGRDNIFDKMELASVLHAVGLCHGCLMNSGLWLGCVSGRSAMISVETVN